MIAILAFLPFIDRYAKWLQNQFRKNEGETSFINSSIKQLNEPDAELLNAEVLNLVARNLEFHDTVMDLNLPENEGFIENFKTFARKSGYTNQMYNRLKVSVGELFDYHTRVRMDNVSQKEIRLMDLAMEALRQIMHSAKSVKDIHHNITELRETAKDILHDHYHRIQQNWIAFKEDFILAKHDRNFLDVLMQKAHTDMADHNELIRENLKNDQLTEVEASTLFNIEREILSSKKAMIRAMDSLTVSSER
jgi:phosphate:Na+ symporter